MERALMSFKNGDQGLNETCRVFGIPKPTLKRHLLSKNKFANGVKKRFGRQCTLTNDIERELAEHVLLLQNHLFGITHTDFMSLAFQLAERNGLSHAFNKEKGTAGKTWFSGFMRRHPELSLRQPEATSQARKDGFNKIEVDQFFLSLGADDGTL